MFPPSTPSASIPGTQALFFAAIGVRTHAFEPMKMNLALLHCSMGSNPGMEDKTLWILPYGLGDKDTDNACLVCAYTHA